MKRTPKSPWNLKRMGQQITNLRMQRGWSQQELARRAGISRGALQAIESGVTKTGPGGPGFNTLCLIWQELGLTPREFFGRPQIEDFHELPFHYDPEYERFYQLLGKIVNNDRLDVHAYILGNLKAHARSVATGRDPLSEDEKNQMRQLLQRLLRDIDREPPKTGT